MALDLIVYAPGAGGNHLKNLLCLSPVFANSRDLDLTIYDFQDPLHANGEVWMRGGRNLQAVFFDAMDRDPVARWILPAHFGELQQFRTRLDSVDHKRVIIITLDHESDRRLLDGRQLRLGQAIHPYWLDEELVWIYQPDTMHKFFGIDHCLTISLSQFWAKEFVTGVQMDQIEQYLAVTLDRSLAQDLHAKWIQANFGQFDQKQDL